MTDDAKKEDGTPAPRTVKFTYLKANQFRVIHADGAGAGQVQRGQIFLNLFSERLPIPQQQTFELAEDGRIGKEIEAKREVRQGIVREVEVSVVMRLTTARALRKLLDTQIRQAEEFAKTDKADEKAEIVESEPPDVTH